MNNDVYALIEHREGKIGEGAYELLGKARELAESLGGDAVALLAGRGVEGLASSLGAAARVVAVGGDGLEHFTPSGYVSALVPVLRDRGPLLTLLPNTAVGMDTAAGLSGALDLPLAAYATEIAAADGQVTVTSQLYGGKLSARSRFSEGRGLVTVIAGAFPADAGRMEGSPAVEVVPAAGVDGRIRFKGLIAPEAGDVDIAKEEILVAVGRGIGDEDDIEVAEELVEALGGALAASRPIVDAGWLPKTRQVGKSGLTVKPKLYIAVGISGAPEHLEGMKDAELIIAINEDEEAPIFGVAHYGVVGDLFDVVPALTDRLSA